MGNLHHPAAFSVCFFNGLVGGHELNELTKTSLTYYVDRIAYVLGVYAIMYCIGALH